jgi:tetratricopeptide (TPR) repeat protein
MKVNPAIRLEKSKIIWLILIGIFVFKACTSVSDRTKRLQTIEMLEWVLLDDNDTNRSAQEKRTDALKLLEEYQTFVSAYPNDSLSAVYLYNQAMMQADQFKRYEESAKLLERFQREYPNHALAAKALFLQAFTYAEYVKDYKRAELIYRSFLQRYPDNEMVPSIEFELNNLGKSPEELLNLNLKND